MCAVPSGTGMGGCAQAWLRRSRVAWEVVVVAIRFRFRVYDTFFFGTAIHSRPSSSVSASDGALEEDGPAASGPSSASAGVCCGGRSRCSAAHGPSSSDDARLRIKVENMAT